MVAAGRAVGERLRMEATAQLLSAIGLAIGTIDYAIVIRRRARQRRRAAEMESVQMSGLQGLVRVMLVSDR